MGAPGPVIPSQEKQLPGAERQVTACGSKPDRWRENVMLPPVHAPASEPAETPGAVDSFGPASELTETPGAVDSSRAERAPPQATRPTRARKSAPRR